MLSSVVEPASRLNLGECSRCNKYRGTAPKDNPFFVTDSEPNCPTRESSASRAEYTSDLSQSVVGAGSSTLTPGSPPRSLASVTHIPSHYGCSQEDYRAHTSQIACDSPGSQTLAALKQEAIKDKRTIQTKWRSSNKSKIPRRKVTGGDRTLREEYFEGMSWTRTFVSGPLDPEHNPYKFYCLICKDNVSIYTKGPREILRHYSSERHIRNGGANTYQLSTLSQGTSNTGSEAKM